MPTSPPSTEIRVYTPDSGLRSPRELVAGMWRDTFSHQSRDLAWRMFVREISSQYRQTLLGYTWIVLPPLVLSIVWIFLNSQKVVEIPDSGIPYPLYAFAGNLLWQAFLLAMQSPIRTVQKEKMLLTKLNFSREALLLAAFGVAMFSGLIQLILLVPVLLFYEIPLGMTFLLAPLGIFLLVLLGFTIGVVLTPIGLLYTDIGRAIPIVGRFWFFITPIVYPIPDTYPASLLNALNPVTPILVNARNWITGQEMVFHGPFFTILAAMLLLLLAGLVVYRLAMPHIVERMSA